MTAQPRRLHALAGVLAVALWLAGLGIYLGTASGPSESASGAEVLAWGQKYTNSIVAGIWIYMIGCLCFVWFAGILRDRIARAEDGGTFSSIAFAGALATAVFGLCMPAGDLAIGLDKNDISASTAATLHRLTDVFFVGAELSAVLLLAGVAAAVWRTGVLPRWWAIVSLVIAVVLLIGPIGWAALLFGMPVWVLATSVFLLRRPVLQRAATPQPIGAY
jgi:hypothetical protein